MYITNTPEECTDSVALIDHHLGQTLKSDVSEMFWEEFEKDENSIKFFVDEITESEWRIKYTKWIGQAWENLCSKPDFILKMAKEVGYCNCLCGCENHLVKILPGYEYEVRAKDSPKTKPLTKEEIEERMTIDKSLILERKRRRRRRLRRKRIEMALKKKEKMNNESKV